MSNADSAALWNIAHLNDLRLLRANFVTYSFSRHSHDYYVLGLVEAGLQKFSTSKDRYTTPPGGMIILNPGDVHTGEAAIASGFQYRALYPDAETMQRIASEVKSHHTGLPYFPKPVIHDNNLFHIWQNLHLNLEQPISVLEDESRYLWALAQLVICHADTPINLPNIAPEKQEVQRLRQYIEERYSENVTLDDLAQHVNWSPYYLLRVFRNTVGLPPHAYLMNFRIKQAQTMLANGVSLVDAAYATGFSHQSHFTRVFKKIIGVTPGQFTKEVNSVQDNRAS